MFKNIIFILFIASLAFGSILATPLSEPMVKDSINDTLSQNLNNLESALLDPEPELAELPLEPLTPDPSPFYGWPTESAIQEVEEEAESVQEETQEIESDVIDPEQKSVDEPSAEDVQVAGEDNEALPDEEINQEYDDTQFEFPTDRSADEELYNF